MNEPGRLERAVSLAVVVVYLLTMVILLLPEHRRRLVLLKLLSRTARTSDLLARRSGHQAMLTELRGARPPYEVPVALGRLREACLSLYERLRVG